VNIGGLALSANHNIKQIVEVCEESEKEEKLIKLLKEIGSDRLNKIIVFVETKKKVDDITKAIRREGYSAISIHGDKSQPERDYVLNEFRSGKSWILVATDVAARGLDVDDVKYVINYDYPNSSEDYVHRIGRTGRCQQTGTAYAFFTSANARQSKDLIAVLKEAGQHISPELADLAQNSRVGQNNKNRWQNRNRDNSSPNSSNSGGRVKTWTNKNYNSNAIEYKQNNQKNMMNGGMRNDHRNQRTFNNSFAYQNSQFNNGQGYQNSYSPPSQVFQHQQQGAGGPRNNYGGNTRYNSQQQRYGRQNFNQSGNPNMYQMPAQPYMMQQTGGPDPMQSIMNHKFFQSNRIPSASNPCAYQSISQGQSAPYSQYPGAVQYATYQFTQPTAAVQQ